MYRNNDVQGSTLCTYVRSDIVLTIQDILLKDTYMFLLLYVRATRKVSYMRYKQHLGESCNVTTTFKVFKKVYKGSTVCTYVRSGVVLIIQQDVLLQDTYMFLLLHVRATRKVSYM